MKRPSQMLISAAVGLSMAFAANAVMPKAIVSTPSYGVTGMELPGAKVRHQTAGRKPGKTATPQRTAAAASGRGVGVTGYVAYADNNEQGVPGRDKGLYLIGADGNFTNLNATDFTQDLDATFGGTLAGDTYVCTYVWQSGVDEIGDVPFIQQWDATDWHLITADFGASAGVLAYDLTYNPGDGKIYGLFVDGNSPVLGILDPATHSRATVAPLTKAFVSIACDEAGTLYAIDFSQGCLYTVNASTGAATLVGRTGVVSAYSASACYDNESGRILWAPTTAAGDAALYSIDPATGAAELVVEFPYNEQVVGLFASPTAVEAAPKGVENFAVNFDNGATTGTVTFSMPEQSIDGAALSGSLEYLLYIDGTLNRSGNAAAGAAVEIPLTVSNMGWHTFMVKARNDRGTSVSARERVYIGYGIPAAPVVSLSREGDVNTITWPAVTECTDGGYLDASAITYRVTRQPGNVVLAQALTANSFSEVFPLPTPASWCTYEVVASNHGVLSEVGLSPRADNGNIIPPYINTFDDAASIVDFTILDANNDGSKWLWNNTKEMKLPYNKDNASDDWLISAPVAMEGGKLYYISVDARCYSGSYREKFGLYLGTAPTAAAMTTEIVGVTELSSTSYAEYGDYFTAPADGLYYIGVHGVSDRNKYALFIDNLSVGAPTSVKAPAPPASLSTIPSPDGSASATILITAPDKAIDGTVLNSPLTITVLRDGVEVKKTAGVVPGSAMSFVDVAEVEKEYTYTVSAANEFGEGKPLKTTAYLGVNKPGAVKNIRVDEPTVGRVAISWDVPQVDVDGNPINGDLIGYHIYRPNEDGRMTLLQGNLTEPSYSYIARPSSVEQDFESWGVLAYTRRGNSPWAYSQNVPVGTPYTLPYKESFEGATHHHVWAVKFITGGEWQITADNSLPGLQSVDQDGGFIAMFSNIATEESMLQTGKIDLSGAQNPVMSFYTYNIVARDPETGEVVGEPDLNHLKVFVNDRTGNGFQQVYTTVINDLTSEGWNRIIVDLTPYKDKVVELGISAYVVTKQYTLVDDLRVFDLFDHNLGVGNIIAPDEVRSNHTFTLSATVENNGRYAADGYTVTLRHNNEEEATLDGVPLAPGARATFAFPQTLNVTMAPDHAYTVEVAYAADLSTVDNVTPVHLATLVHSDAPMPTNLVANVDGNNVVLTWDEPDTDVSVAEPRDESFESGEAFAHEFEGWTFVDADQLPIGDFASIGMPGIIEGEKMSWFIMDANFHGWMGHMAAHTGQMMLAQCYTTGGPCDDWAISPELYGGPQTISFYARTYNRNYPESFEVLYSPGGKELSEFISLNTKRDIGDDFAKYTFDLPDGANYFAVRCISDDCAMLLLDDFTFCPYIESGFDLEGYNVYRNGLRLNDTPLSAATHTDVVPLVAQAAPSAHLNGQPESYAYQVSALYPAAESRATEAVIVTGTEGLTSAKADPSIRVATLPAAIEITAPAQLPYTLVTPSGLTVASGVTPTSSAMGATPYRLPVAPGIYLLTLGTHTYKLLVP